VLGRLTEPKKQTIIDISNSVYSLNAHAQMFQERLRECHRPTRKEKLHFKDFETIKEILQIKSIVDIAVFHAKICSL
jgi:hypothetical protein